MVASIVREGIIDDINSILPLARVFWGHSVYKDAFDPNSVKIILNACIEQKLMSVLDIEGIQGFACGVSSFLLGNMNIKLGTELAWWVNEDHRKGRNGIKLIKHLEGLAKKQNIKYWNMGYMETSMPESIKKLYDRMGYTRVETMYMKEL